MVPLDVYTEKKKTFDLTPEEERKVEVLHLRLRSATILFDQERNPDPCRLRPLLQDDISAPGSVVVRILPGD